MMLLPLLKTLADLILWHCSYQFMMTVISVFKGDTSFKDNYMTLGSRHPLRIVTLLLFP